MSYKNVLVIKLIKIIIVLRNSEHPLIHQKYFLVIWVFLLLHLKSRFFCNSFFSPDFDWFFGPKAAVLNKQHTTAERKLPLLGDKSIACWSSLRTPYNHMNWGIVETYQQKHTLHLFFSKTIILQPLQSQLLWPPSYQRLKSPMYQSTF